MRWGGLSSMCRYSVKSRARCQSRPSARRFAADYAETDDDEPLRSILFLAFTAEESGLNGSRYFVDHSTISPSAITAMVNMDMIGRLRSRELMVAGIGTAQEFDTLLDPHFEKSGLTIATSPGGRGPSDHANFFGAGLKGGRECSISASHP